MIDLHMHTKYSDGSDSCIEILNAVQNRGLDVISITDHNTALAYEELGKIDIDELYKGRIIPGIELNTKVLNIPIEILGYGIDYKKMNKLVEQIYIPAEKRNIIEVERLYNKCIKAGMNLEKNCLENYNSKDFASKFIHREITKKEENKRFISDEAWNDVKIFYRAYMSNPEGLLYVEMDDFVPDFNTAADLIRKSDGLVFLPHIFEYRENSERILSFILENYRIDGIECYYTTFSKEQTNKLVKICKQRNLYKSGGSDYHGRNKPGVNVGIGMGNLLVENTIIDEWKEKVKFFK